jgi:hypothetical protein
MNKRRWLWVTVAGIVLVAGIGAWWAVYEFWPESRPDFGYKKSSDLPADLKRMWETGLLGGTPDETHGPNPRASTVRAINAAHRVFNTVELVGKTREEVIALLGDPTSSSDSLYRSPYAFWPHPPDVMVYSFTNGAYGWQFNIAFDREGRVNNVERLWIH